MLEDAVKDRVIAITSYCNTEEKLNVLIANISMIRLHFSDYKIALHANYPLEPNIQKLVDMYFYSDLNHTENKRWIYYWNIITENNKAFFNKKFVYSIPDTGFSVFQQIKFLTKILIDYKWVMLINYDTAVEEIRSADYTEDYDLILHYFPDHKAYSLIMMFFNPQVFYDKVARYFTRRNWASDNRINQLNEERFFDMVNSSDIKLFAHDYKVPDKISGEPDYLKPNAPMNPYFTNYLLYYHEDMLEVYLWGLKKNIQSIVVNNNQGGVNKLNNMNKNGAFESIIPSNRFETLTILEIDDKLTDIDLKIKKGYEVKPI